MTGGHRLGYKFHVPGEERNEGKKEKRKKEGERGPRGERMRKERKKGKNLKRLCQFLHLNKPIPISVE